MNFFTLATFSAEDPIIVIQPSDTVVPYGNTVLLTCVAISKDYREDQLVNIYWERDMELIVASNSSDGASVKIYEDYIYEGGYYFTRSILEICSVTLKEEGEYSCVANDTVGTTAAYFNMTVFTNGKKLCVCVCVCVCVSIAIV